MQLYNNIKSLRIKNGYTQGQVASLLQLSLYGYQKIERGESDMRISTFLNICELYNIAPSELIYNNYCCF